VEGARVGDVGQTGVHGVGAWVEDEVVDGERVGAGAAGRGRGRGVVGRYCLQARGDVFGRCGFVEGAVQRGEEVVDVAVEGGDA